MKSVIIKKIFICTSNQSIKATLKTVYICVYNINCSKQDEKLRYITECKEAVFNMKTNKNPSKDGMSC